MTIEPFVIGAFGTVTKGLLKGQEDMKFGGPVETMQTTASLKTDTILRRDLKRLAVSQTPRKNHQRQLMWKTLREHDNNNKRPCGDKNETINFMIWDFSKLFQKRV